LTVSGEIAQAQIAQLLASAPLRFDQDSSVLGTENIPTMERLTALLASSPKSRFSIRVDDNSSPSQNLDRKRATYIRSSLVARGTDSSRLVVDDNSGSAASAGVPGITVTLALLP
jgi:hypothetical protein